MSRPAKHANANELILAAIRRGTPLKQIAFDLGHCQSWIYSKAQSLGFCAVLIDRAEAKLISEYRRNKTKNT